MLYKGEAEMKQKLSAKRREILDFIVRFTSEHGYPPSVREICAAVNLRSPSSVHSHLRLLSEGGYIQKDDRKTRAISPSASLLSAVRRVPILGTVTAGVPIEAIENVEGYLPFDPRFEGEEYFALTIKGDSMTGAGILDGDFIVVRSQPDAISGEIVVALIDGEATCKRLKKDGAAITLMPENEAYEPIDGASAEILGKVEAVIRRY